MSSSTKQNNNNNNKDKKPESIWSTFRIFLICGSLPLFTLVPMMAEGYFANTAHHTMESFIQESILHVKSTPNYKLVHTAFWKFVWALYLNLEQIGLIIGGLATPWITHHLGRPKTAVAAVCFAIPGRSMQMLANVPGAWVIISYLYITLFIGKAVGNIGLGIIMVVLPIFVSEIGQKGNRDKLGLLNPLGHSVGALLGALMGLRMVLGSYHSWLYAYVLFTLFLFPAIPILMSLPESPAFLLSDGDGDETEVRRSLTFYHGHDGNMEASKEDAKLIILQGGQGIRAFYDLLTTRMLWKPLMLAASVSVAYFPVILIQQYSTIMMEHAGLDMDTAGFCSLFLKFCSMCSFIVCILLAGRLNRRVQLIVGYFGTCLAMSLLCLWQYLKTVHQVEMATMAFVITLITLQVTLNFGVRPVYWVILPEMFPFRYRAVAKSSVNILSYICQISMSISFLPVLFEINYLAYLFISFPLWACFTYCALHFPETDNRDLHEVFMKIVGGGIVSNEHSPLQSSPSTPKKRKGKKDSIDNSTLESSEAENDPRRSGGRSGKRKSYGVSGDN